MFRILLVDRHGVYRNGLRLALQLRFPESQILEAENLQEAREKLHPDGVFDLVLVDIDDPGASFDTLRLLRQSHPRTRLVGLSATTRRAAILDSLDSGLFGLISKSQSDEEIFAAIRDVLSGRIYVPLTIAELEGVNGTAAAEDECVLGTRFAEREAHPGKLTPRQRQILHLLARGMSNKEIARALKIAEGTTKVHASSLIRVLGVRNRTEAAIAARNYFVSIQMPRKRRPAGGS